MKHNNKALKWILSSSRPQLLNIIFLAILYGLHAFIGVYSTVYARELVNSAAYGGELSEVIKYGILYISVTVIQLTALVMSRNLIFVVTTKLENNMRLRLFKSMLNKDFGDISAFHSGEMMNRLTGDIGVVAGAITHIVPNVVFFVVKLIGILYILPS